jgi:murein DD-endopeptidase MepM/ murein hydrolase activator NlpD
MNPEDLDLPKPPEGILDPKLPWYPGKVGEKTWIILKAKLTGGEAFGTGYSSTVNLTSADADKLIENLKKDPRGYPQMDDGGGGRDFYDNLIAYQEWLREEYLEKPFRKQVDDKIEARQIQTRISEIVSNRKPKNVKAVDPFITPMDPWEGSYVNSSDIVKPVQQDPQEETKPIALLPPASTTKQKRPSRLIPKKFPNAARQKIALLSSNLASISAELSSQIVLVKRRESVLKSSNQGLKLAQFLVGQQIENYSEFLNDLETKSVENSRELKVDTAEVKEPQQKPQSKIPESKSEAPPPQKKWWEIWKPDTKPESPKKASAGLMSTSMPAMAKGGVSLGTGTKNIIQPGIYDNPVVGNLAPGSAVIPLNRNYGKDMFGNYDEIRYINAFSDIMSLPMKGLLGYAISVYGNILPALGPLAGYFNTSLPKLVSSVASILGVPTNIVLDMFGGPANAGVIPNDIEERKFYKSWKIYMDKNGLHFEGGYKKDEETIKGEIAEDILVIGKDGEGLGGIGGTNVGKPPAWIPFSKSDSGKVHYTSGFGPRWGKEHKGMDLAGAQGIKIITPFAGEVYDVNRGAVEGDHSAGGRYGNLVGIAHESPKIFTFYGHLKDVADSIEVGKKVKAGQVIGTLGNTGFSTGPHLHWEVRTEAGGGQIDPVEWTHQNKPSFSGGGWLGVVSSLASKIVKKPQGLSIRGVQAGFTGMAKQGFEAIMGGDAFRLGKWKPQILGRGAYSAPTAKGAQRYAGSQGSLGGKQTPGGVVKSIVPGGARRINILEPQAAVKPATFDKGKILADKLLDGLYSNSPLANKLRNQLLSGGASVGSDIIKLGRLGGKILGVVGPALDLAFPDPVGTFDQISGPNAYYNAPGYRAKPSSFSSSKPAAVATQSKSSPKISTVQLPVQSTPVMSPTSTKQSTSFANLGMDTNTVMEMEMLRRVR